MIAAFLRFWGVVFFVSTTLVALLKRETDADEETDGVVETYRLLMRIVRLPAVISLVLILLTSKVSVRAWRRELCALARTLLWCVCEEF